MEDYLTTIKNKYNKDHETAVDSEKMKEYQNYVTLIHKSFDILKEREFNLIESLKNCKEEKDDNHLYFHYDKETSTEAINNTLDTYEPSKVEPTNFPEQEYGPSDKDDKIFPSADRAMQKLRTKDEEFIDQADALDTVTKNEASLGDEDIPTLITSAVTGCVLSLMIISMRINESVF